MSFRSLAFGTLAVTALLAGSAGAQDATPAAPAAQTAAAPATQPDTSGPQPDWMKICQSDPKGKMKMCRTLRDLRASTGQTLASVALQEITDGKKTRRVISLFVPPGMLIQPGVRIVVDSQPAIDGKYSVCMPVACLVNAELPDKAYAIMRKGKQLTLQTVAGNNQVMQFKLGLDGFTTALDGEPFDVEKYKERQQSLQHKLEEKARAELQKSQAAPAQ